MIETRSPSTAVNKHKGLQQFFKWLRLDEQVIDRSPVDRVRQPKTPVTLVPVMADQDTTRLLDACRGKGFTNLRDEAIIRLYCATGARLSEVGNLLLSDLDLSGESVHYRGKGAKPFTGLGHSYDHRPAPVQIDTHDLSPAVLCRHVGGLLRRLA
jgi:site-specific recombinase XerD